MDREPVAALPPGGRVRLVTRQSEDAAAVVRAVAPASELVGDRVAPGWCRRAGAADADGGGAHDPTALEQLKAPSGEIDPDRDPRALRSQRRPVGLHPAELAV